jgi:protein-S-isoprenylcysteine O-methyltransferase Ste14
MKKHDALELMGEAPRLLPFFLPILAVPILLGVFLPDAMSFEGRFRGPWLLAGIELAAFGLVFWADAAIRLIRAWKAGAIATRGAWGLCRHPIYSWWIFSVLPSIALIADSWAFLVAALALRLAVQGAADREEEAMLARFGQDYFAYQFRARAFLPLPLLRPFRFRRYLKAAGVLACMGLLALAVWFGIGRPVALGLGATAAERRASLPGDALVDSPRSVYTQAIDIKAPPEKVWAWLVQVGYRRAGWYNVDAINRLAAKDYFIDGNASSRRIHPELQGLAVGDTIYLVPILGLRVVELEPARRLVLAGDPANPRAETNVSWAYFLEPRDGGNCRLVTRFRGRYPSTPLSVFANSLVNDVGGALIQQPAMLRGLKYRAERL